MLARLVLFAFTSSVFVCALDDALRMVDASHEEYIPHALVRRNSTQHVTYPNFKEECHTHTAIYTDTCHDRVRYCVDSVGYAQFCQTENGLRFKVEPFLCPYGYECETFHVVTGAIIKTQNIYAAGKVNTPPKNTPWSVQCVSEELDEVQPSLADVDVLRQSSRFRTPTAVKKMYTKYVLTGDTSAGGEASLNRMDDNAPNDAELVESYAWKEGDTWSPKIIDFEVAQPGKNPNDSYQMVVKFNKPHKKMTLVWFKMGWKP